MMYIRQHPYGMQLDVYGYSYKLRRQKRFIIWRRRRDLNCLLPILFKLFRTVFVTFSSHPVANKTYRTSVKSSSHPDKGKNKGKYLRIEVKNYSTSPYLTLMRSSFSSMGSAATRMKITVAAAWIRSMGRPDT